MLVRMKFSSQVENFKFIEEEFFKMARRIHSLSGILIPDLHPTRDKRWPNFDDYLCKFHGLRNSGRSGEFCKVS
ncbi:hypothetical protein NC651_028324 [Populus alba x Populus x berolinensis]|nr:hypothetical protein NC651_028324 [Populus alba x Populus x berolinensis]